MIKETSGVAQARRLAALVDPRTEAFGESWTKLRIADAGFPLPEPQIRLYDSRGVEIYRLDMGYHQLAFEYGVGEVLGMAPKIQVRRW